MKFTGTNILYTPRVACVNYLFKNIIVNSTGVYSFSSSQNIPFPTGADTSAYLFILSGNKVLDASGRFTSTYNTGENLSVSGWLDYTNGYRFLSVEGMLSRTKDDTASSGLLSNFTIVCPAGKELTCDIKINSSEVVGYAAFSNFNIDGSVTGFLYSNAPMYVHGGTMQFFKSYESLLTGSSLVAYIDTRYQTPIVYYDNDTSFTNNDVEFDYHYNTSYDEIIDSFVIARTGLYNSGIYTFMGFDSTSSFSGLFDGYWSGSGFFYKDAASYISFDLLTILNDQAGGTYPKTITYELTINRTGEPLKADYISGFSLTASGEYLSIPSISVSGYYYCTGIQQSVDSLLFSSGCTGDLLVTFANMNGYGTGASGLLHLSLINFSNVYAVGNKQHNIVTSYTSLGGGTGYMLAPTAFVNTGQYGSPCFDVPKESGYNYAWYRPFNTVGALETEAGWFTGEVLCATGLVSGGLLTGYFVTGIDVYNIGTGYSNVLPPLITFIRNDNPTGLISGASGNFVMHTGSILYNSNFTLQTGLAGTSLTGAPFTGSISLDEYSDYLSFQLSCTGIDITEAMSGSLDVSWDGLLVDFPFTYCKYFSTGSDFLKKKINTVIYNINTELGFGTTQNELDSLYNGAGYIGNEWPFEEGDYSFE